MAFDAAVVCEEDFEGFVECFAEEGLEDFGAVFGFDGAFIFGFAFAFAFAFAFIFGFAFAFCFVVGDHEGGIDDADAEFVYAFEVSGFWIEDDSDFGAILFKVHDAEFCIVGSVAVFEQAEALLKASSRDDAALFPVHINPSKVWLSQIADLGGLILLHGSFSGLQLGFDLLEESLPVGEVFLLFPHVHCHGFRA